MIKKVKKGFTLIELVVVIAVIAILSAVSVVAYVGITNSAKKSAAEQKAGQIVTAVRAAALASDKGYTEAKRDTTEEKAFSEGAYTVTINGKELSFKVEGHEAELTEADKVKILNDMLFELESQADLKCDKYDVTDHTSKIGVYKQGTTEAVWASF